MATQPEIAAHLDLSTRRVAELLKIGILPTAKGVGALDIDACRVAYLRYLRGVPNRSVNDDPLPSSEGLLDLEQERAREAKERTDKLAMENAERRGELAPVEVLRDAQANNCGQHAAIFDAIPAKIKRRVPRLTANELDLIRKEIAKARNLARKARLTE